MDVSDLVQQVGVIPVPVGDCPSEPLVVARTGHLQHPAGHCDVDLLAAQLLDQPERYFGRTFSRAK